MFSATAHQVAKALGKETLHPVPSLNEADNIEILRILIKKKRKWLFFTRTPDYETTEFNLSDILDKDDDDSYESLMKDVSTDSHLLTTYDSKTNFSLKGKFGAELTKELLDVKLSMTDSVVVSSQLGDLNKVELTIPKLLALSEKRKIDIDHPIVSVACQDKRKSICLVTSVIQLDQDGKITSNLNLEGSAELDSKPLDIETKGEITRNKSKSMTIPKSTSVAFSMIELLISVHDGAFQLMLSKDQDGGFTTEDIDTTDSPVHECEPIDMLKRIKSCGKEKDLMRAAQQLLEAPKAIKSLIELFREAEVNVDLGMSHVYSMNELHQDFNFDHTTRWQPFLSCADFMVTDDKIHVPDKSSAMFDICYLLLTLFNELDDDVIDCIAQCLLVTITTQKALPAIERLISEKSLDFKLSKQDVDVLSAVPVKQLTTALNINIQSKTLDVHVPAENRFDLQATYYILNALQEE